MRWFAVWVLLVASCAAVVSQEAASAQGTVSAPGTLAQEPSLTVTRGGRSRTMSLAGKSPQQNFKTLERAIEQMAQPGDKIHIVGTFVGGPLDMLDLNNLTGGELTGSGPEQSRIICKAHHDRIGPKENPQKPSGPAILLPNNGEIFLAGLYLENTPANVHEDGALAGWWPGVPGGSSATFEDCQVKAHDWGMIYDWTVRAARSVTLRRVSGVAARSFISLMTAGSRYSLIMEDCDIGIDGNLSVSYGATSEMDPVTGGVLTPIILRAGSGHAKNCTFWVRGMTRPEKHPLKWMPTRIVTIATDQFYSQGARTTRFYAENCRVKFVEPADETVILDLDFRFGQGAVDDPGRSGSGPNGELRMRTSLQSVAPLPKG